MKSHQPATQVDPIRAPNQTAIHPNQHFFFFAKYIASKRLFGPVSPPKTLFLSQPTLAEPKEESHPSATLGYPIRAPKQPAIRLNQQFFFAPYYIASMRHSWPSITTYNPTPVSAYLRWTQGGNPSHLQPKV